MIGELGLAIGGHARPDIVAEIHDALRAKHAAGDTGTGNTARFVCAVALAQGERILFETCGTVEGEIAAKAKGSGGFGYDPIFFYPPFGQTLAEAGDRKAAVSHRGEAFRALAAVLATPKLPSPDSSGGRAFSFLNAPRPIGGTPVAQGRKIVRETARSRGVRLALHLAPCTLHLAP